jgi:type IV secretory pathway TrbD component
MDRLSIFLTLIVGAMITGGLVAVVLSLGWYSWPAIGGAAALGVVLTWPVSYAISRRIKRQDPNWDATKVDRVEGVIPDPSAPEV